MYYHHYNDNFYSRTSCEVRQSWAMPELTSANFYSRTSCEVRPLSIEDFEEITDFYSRTSCEVRLEIHVQPLTYLLQFLLTHLLRGATIIGNNPIYRLSISTHAPLARCDEQQEEQPPVTVDFYSRTSCEVRLDDKKGFGAGTLISTHAPLARCDKMIGMKTNITKISTHAPLARCDICSKIILSTTLNFYSRTSCEVRLNKNSFINVSPKFLLTHLLRGATSFVKLCSIN